MSSGAAFDGVILADDPSQVAVTRAVAAEAFGFARFHLADLGMDGGDQWVTLGAIAARTSRIKLGLVTNPYTRAPAVTANALRTLDAMTGGRAFVLLARGGERILNGARARAVRPLAAIGETLAVIAEHAPGVERWVATKGPRTMELALRHADGLMLSGVPHALLPEVTARLRAGAQRPISLGLSIAYGGDGTTPTPTARMRVALELGNMREEYRAAADVEPALIDAVKAQLFGGGTLAAAAELIPDELIARFTLVAPRPELAARIARLRAHTGVDFVELSVSAAIAEDGALLVPNPNTPSEGTA